MRIRWGILGFVWGAIAGVLVGLSVWAALRLAGWPILVPVGSFELLRWGGAGAFAGSIVGAFSYPQIKFGFTYFNDPATRAALGGSEFLPLLGGWTGILVLGAFFGAWIGGFAGGICGASYAGRDDATEPPAFFGSLSGLVVGAPVGIAISALLGAISWARSGNLSSDQDQRT